MELAIPLVAVGGLYVASKQKRENFTGSKIPNVDIKDKNYPPSFENKESDHTSQLSTTNKYDTPHAYTDKYFNQNFAKDLENSYTGVDGAKTSSVTFTSLTGEQVEKDHFKHNNMVPFFGGSIRSKKLEANGNESILDNYIGSGSNYITKQEQAPMFKPGENYQYPNGTPNTTDFMRSRVNPSQLMANIKPFKEERVGPGLNLGYTTEGAGGFNSGMMSRETWNAKTVDELHVLTNPKSTGNVILGYEGPANSAIKTMGSHGKQEKNRVERDFEMTQDRLFTTTGAERGPTQRSEQIDRNVTRPHTTTSYSGGATYGNSSIYVDGEHNDPHRIQLDSYPISGVSAVGTGNAKTYDYGVQSKMAYPNNRSSNNQDGYFGSVGGVINAAVAPLLDILKPTRKENVIGNLRPYENAKAEVSNSYLYNPNDKPLPTIRETTENSKLHMNINANQRGGAYEVTQHQPINNARIKQGDYLYVGNSSAAKGNQDMRSYDAEYNQRNNDLKSSTIKGRLSQGNMNLYSGNINQHSKPKDNDLLVKRPIAKEGPKESISVHSMGRMNQAQPLSQNINNERNTPDIMKSLQGNPYVIPYMGKK